MENRTSDKLGSHAEDLVLAEINSLDKNHNHGLQNCNWRLVQPHAGGLIRYLSVPARLILASNVLAAALTPFSISLAFTD